jgi:hypothetical protein
MELGDDFELTDRLMGGHGARRGSLPDDYRLMCLHHGLLLISLTTSCALGNIGA